MNEPHTYEFANAFGEIRHVVAEPRLNVRQEAVIVAIVRNSEAGPLDVCFEGSTFKWWLDQFEVVEVKISGLSMHEELAALKVAAPAGAERYEITDSLGLVASLHATEVQTSSFDRLFRGRGV